VDTVKRAVEANNDAVSSSKNAVVSKVSKVSNGVQNNSDPTDTTPYIRPNVTLKKKGLIVSNNGVYSLKNTMNT
jgi:hypothetical protein